MKRATTYYLAVFLIFFFFGIAYPGEQTVYITKTGSKYHLSGCSYLRKSAIPISLTEAVKGYSPCSRCNPPKAESLATNPETQKKDEAEPTADSKILKDKEEVTPAKLNQTSTDNQSGTEVGTTATGKIIYEGPRGGRYHYSASGKKVYERKK